MGYLTSYRGDYLASYRGDPGFFSFIGKAIKGAAGIVSKLGIPGLSGVAGVIGGAAGRRMPVLRGPPIMGGQAFPGGRQLLQVPVPGVKGRLQRLVPGGATGYMPGPRRRRMNPANPKALRRAIRRQTSFIRLARRALKGSGYTIQARGAGRRRPARIQEFGPGSVTVAR